jgi:hypothetical protein
MMKHAPLTGPACRAARALLGWTMRDLRDASAVSLPTIQKLEQGGAVFGSTASKLVSAFERQGVQITNGVGTGVRLLPIWRVDFAKDGRSFTACPGSGQPPRIFPALPTQDAMREWLFVNGYDMVGDDEDRWVFTGAKRNPALVDDETGLPMIAQVWWIQPDRHLSGWWRARLDGQNVVESPSFDSREQVERWLRTRGFFPSKAHPNAWTEQATGPIRWR